MKKKLTFLFTVLSVIGLGLSACNKEQNGEEPPEECAHVYNGYLVDGNYHYQKCTLCGHETEREAHRGGSATCEHKAVCDICHAEYGALEEHTFGKWVMEADNLTQHYHECSVCHKKEYANHVFDKEVVKDEFGEFFSKL